MAKAAIGKQKIMRSLLPGEFQISCDKRGGMYATDNMHSAQIDVVDKLPNLPSMLCRTSSN
jgi:hypothetical protein